MSAAKEATGSQEEAGLSKDMLRTDMLPPAFLSFRFLIATAGCEVPGFWNHFTCPPLSLAPLIFLSLGMVAWWGSQDLGTTTGATRSSQAAWGVGSCMGPLALLRVVDRSVSNWGNGVTNDVQLVDDSGTKRDKTRPFTVEREMRDAHTTPKGQSCLFMMTVE